MSCTAALAEEGKARLDALNQSCFCMPLSRAALDAAIVEDAGLAGLGALLAGRANLFAGTGVFLAPRDLDAMLEQIHAIEAAVRLPDYQCAALAGSDRAVTGVQVGMQGVFMGYDFHITPVGPRLIEINTNAGGAFLVNALDRAAAHSGIPGHTPFAPGDFEQRVVETILSDWHLAGRTGAPATLAIVDDVPGAQYLYPDMLLAKRVIEQAGIDTLIVDAAELTSGAQGLTAGGRRIDMVYNRLTDFALADPASEAIRDALARDRIVLTPAPRHHALYADKRNLVRLTDLDRLKDWGLASHHARALEQLPETIDITAQTADAAWANRKRFFFKPAAGFGGRAAYRGDKITRKVWSDILAGDYIAQAYISPSSRSVATLAGERTLKYDLRVYTYAGDPLLLAARVYQGQTTNFRTEGGGFAPVIVSND